MHNIDLILILTIGLGVALVLGYLTNLLRLSPIVGYLLAGVVIGPHTPGFIGDQGLAEQLAEIGVMLLMFGVGLHFHLGDLLAVRKIAIPGAVGQISVATVLGAVAAHFFGWDWQAGVLFGLSLSVASTVVLTRILIDNRALHTRTGHVAVGWLIVEDLFTVLVLVVLPVFFGEHKTDNLLASLVLMAVKLAVLTVAIFYVGGRFIPWYLAKIARSGSQELFTLAVLVTVLVVAVGSAKLFDVSMALAAFLAGMVVGKSEFSLRAAADVLPLRDAFAVLFFVSVGMLLDPQVLIDNPLLLLATLAIVIVGKGLAALVIILVLGYPLKLALAVSVALAQIGEFSFILASLGLELEILPPLAINILVATAIASITINPLLYRSLPRIEGWALKLFGPSWTRPVTGADVADQASSHAQSEIGAVIVGFGPTGQTLARLFSENGIATAVIELNLELSRTVPPHGARVIYGDASRKEVLENSGLRFARTLILSSSTIAAPQELIRIARELNPGIRIVARTAYIRELSELKRVGCSAVFAGEGEVALALIEDVLRELDASAEQIERERLRFREETIDALKVG